MTVYELVTGEVSVDCHRPTPPEMAEFEKLYRSEFGAITGYFARRTKDPQTVADLTSDAFLQAMVSFRSFDPKRGSARAWLFGVARHVYANRSAASARHLEAIWRAGGQRSLDSDEIEELAQRIDAERATKKVLEQVRSLPTLERGALELVDIVGLSPKEAAQVVGVSPGALRVRLFRARGRLKKEGQER